jgi:inosose dehydratase
VSWAVYEADRPNPPYATVLDEIAGAGYEGTELGPYGYLPTDPDALRRELASRRLALGSSFVPLPLEDADARERSVHAALRVGRLLSTQGVGEVIIADDEDAARASRAGRADAASGWSDTQWREAVATLHAVARALRRELDMRVVVHHHAGTFLETPDEVDRLLAETDPDLVNLLLDTGHSVYGGDDPLDVVRRHGDRIRYVHLKDVRSDELARVRDTDLSMSEAWARGVFCPLGDGLVDFPGLVEALRGRAYAGWVIVEQDVVPDATGVLSPEPSQSARQSRAYLRERVGL